MEKEPIFNFDQANLADQITVIGTCEHIFEHACKSASVSSKEDAVFYQTLADMTKDFRRAFMKRHFPTVTETDWCLLKAADTLRQRVYESTYTSYEDLKAVNELWATLMEHIFDEDLSGCIVCKADKESAEEREEQKSQEK